MSSCPDFQRLLTREVGHTILWSLKQFEGPNSNWGLNKLEGLSVGSSGEYTGPLSAGAILLLKLTCYKETGKI